MNIASSKKIIEYCKKEEVTLDRFAILYELENTESTEEDIVRRMHDYWDTMKKAIETGIEGEEIQGKIIGGQARKLLARNKEELLSGKKTIKGIAYALSVMEVNASMGLIVAAPTAGASGVLPGVLKAIQEARSYTDDKIVEALFVASIIGMIIAKNASISGAKGGCQAEVGSASAMASGALVYLEGGTIEEIFDAGAICLKNLMGLVCDPVAGLVEVPCQKRNAIGASNAMISADMVLAGIHSFIPFDEVVIAMKQVGDVMPSCHRETAMGGVAITPTGKKYAKDIMGW